MPFEPIYFFNTDRALDASKQLMKLMATPSENPTIGILLCITMRGLSPLFLFALSLTLFGFSTQALAIEHQYAITPEFIESISRTLETRYNAGEWPDAKDYDLIADPHSIQFSLHYTGNKRTFKLMIDRNEVSSPSRVQRSIALRAVPDDPSHIGYAKRITEILREAKLPELPRMDLPNLAPPPPDANQQTPPEDSEQKQANPHLKNILITIVTLLPLFLLLLFLVRGFQKASQPRNILQNSDYLILIGFAVFLFLQAYFFCDSSTSTVNSSVDRNRAGALLIARGMEHSLLGPKAFDAPIFHGPLFYYFLAPLTWLGDLMSTYLILSVGMAILTLAIGYYFLNRHFSRTAAVVFAFLYCMQIDLIHEFATLTHDYLSGPFEVLTFIAIWEFIRTRERVWLCIAVLSAGLTCQLILTHAPLFIVLFAVLWSFRRDLRPTDWFGLFVLIFISQAITLWTSIETIFFTSTEVSSSHFLWTLTSLSEFIAKTVLLPPTSLCLLALPAWFWLRRRAIAPFKEQETQYFAGILLFAIILPYSLLTLTFPLFRVRYAQSYILQLCLLSAPVLSEFLLSIDRQRRKHLIAVSVSASIILFFGIMFFLSRESRQHVDKTGFQYHEMKNLAEALISFGAYQPSVWNSRLHGSNINSKSVNPTFDIHLARESAPNGALPFGDFTSFWLTTTPSDRMDEGVMITELSASSKPLDYRLVAYKSHLRQLAVSQYPDLLPANIEQYSESFVPFRYWILSDETQRFTQIELKSIAPIKENEQLPRGTLRVEAIQLPTSTHPFVVTSTADCAVHVCLDGETQSPHLQETDTEAKIKSELFILPSGRTGLWQVDIDTRFCVLEYLDLYDPPLISGADAIL